MAVYVVVRVADIVPVFLAGTYGHYRETTTVYHIGLKCKDRLVSYLYPEGNVFLSVGVYRFGGVP